MRLRPLRRPRSDVATCAEAMRNLQAFLDGEIRDELTLKRVEAHLEICRRCGLEAETYRAIKESLRMSGQAVDQGVVDRLTDFARRIEEDAEEE